MNQQSNQLPMTKSRRTLWVAAAVALLSGSLAGCTRPGDEDVLRLMKQTYACKNMEVVELIKTDSLPGIYSYVGQYVFQFRFVEGEAGAIKFFKGLLAEQEVKKDDKDPNWEQWIRKDKVQDYIGDECTEAAQLVLERMTETVLPQIADKKESIRVPIVMPVTGWSEFMPGRKGWDITMRRDKLVSEPMFSEPIKQELLLPKQGAKPAKGKKK